MYNVQNIPIEQLKGVGVKRAKLYHKLGVDSVYALLRYFPRSYIDLSDPKPVMQAPLNEYAVLHLQVIRKRAPQSTRAGLRIFQVDAADESGSLRITLFNNRFAFEDLSEGAKYYFYGKVTGNFTKKQMQSPLIIPDTKEYSMRPVYPLTAGLTSNMIITNQKQALSLFQEETLDLLPPDIIKEHRLLDVRSAYRHIHFPAHFSLLQKARERLVLEELLSWQIGLCILRQKRREITRIRVKKPDLTPFMQSLPFSLTGAQQQVLRECVQDMAASHPMNRLVQGDVGSGKTVIAAALCYLMAQNGYQSAMMAPTEILAMQHYHTLRCFLEPLGVRVSYLTGSMKKKEKTARKEELAKGECEVIVGTHALFQESASFASLGLVITDEQHRFGVRQRQKLTEKGDHPHTMVMSATPIPRTLALILYGDLDISVIDELPKGRKKIQTMAVPISQRRHALGFIKEELRRGRQAYIVCPAIEPDERRIANIQQYQGKLKEWFSPFQVGCIHSKIPAKEKEEVMLAFQKNEIQLLLGTTVVEVGVDVPNATVMMVENADLFGLSQLHQLRGRVGRGKEESYCILLSDHPKQNERLQVLCETGDGFLIAEKDLQLRGPGDFFGSRQHGLPNFKIADMVQDMDMLKKARAIAEEVLRQDPELKEEKNRGLSLLVKDLFGEAAGIL